MSTDTDVRERRLPLEGGVNLRDFGGYRTSDGRTVAWGRLYRSGGMHRLTEADAAHLRALGIRAICDFRREKERTGQPTRWHEGGDQIELLALNSDVRTGELHALFNSTEATRPAVIDAMTRLYRDIPIDHAPSYRAMFDRLADGRTPLLINCTAGKDRTGCAAAMILTLLGVPREAVYEDYALTNRYLSYRQLFPADLKRPDGSAVDLHIFEPLALAEPVFLDALFDTLDRDYGGLEGYLADTLGIDADRQRAIRDHLLVP